MFRYDIVEEKLIAYFTARRRKQPNAYRSWVKLVANVGLIARLDFAREDAKVARSEAWQEIDIAFRGHGDASLTGLIQDIYYNLGTAYHLNLAEIEAVFKEAWAATPAGYKPLHKKSYLKSPFALVGEERAIATPTRGGRLEAQAFQYYPEQAYDIIEFYEAAPDWSEEAAANASAGTPSAVPAAPKNPHGFQLIPGGKGGA